MREPQEPAVVHGNTQDKKRPACERLTVTAVSQLGLQDGQMRKEAPATPSPMPLVAPDLKNEAVSFVAKNEMLSWICYRKL